MSDSEMSNGEGFTVIAIALIGILCIIFGLTRHNWMLWATGVVALGVVCEGSEVSNIKREIELAAIATIKCPSCGALPTEQCHFVGSGGGLARLRKVKTHQRRLSAFMSSNNVKWEKPR